MLLLWYDLKHGLSVTPKSKNRLPLWATLLIYALTVWKGIRIQSNIFSALLSKDIKTIFVK